MSAAAVIITRKIEQIFNKLHPWVVTNAPDAKDVVARVANTQKLIAACARFFSFG